MESNEMVQLDDVLTELRRDAKTLAKDLISGVQTVKLTSVLLLFIAAGLAYFAFVFLLVFPLLRGGDCCYTLTWGDLIGGLTSILAIPFTLWRSLTLRRKYRSLRSRYEKLLELENALRK